MCLKAALVLIQFSQKLRGKARKTRGGAATKKRDENRGWRIEDSESSRGELQHCAKNTKFGTKNFIQILPDLLRNEH
jgi:hypothetical protein